MERCMEGWLQGCMEGWLHGMLEGWLHGMLEGWLHGMLEGWLHGMLEGWLACSIPDAGWKAGWRPALHRPTSLRECGTTSMFQSSIDEVD